MKSFTDNLGRSWTLTVNVSTIKRVRALCNLNILDLITVDDKGQANADMLEKLSSDPVLLVDVLYAICKTECDAKNVTDEEFGAALSGDSIENATRSLLEEIVDFFPEAKRRIFQKVLAATRRFEEATKAKLQLMMDGDQLDKELDSRLQMLNDSFTNAPASAE